ncbi:MAG: type 4a pilus biogenesis protein PilO [Deltaproteobacteria bacterium]|nr:type 4a pilus biogenesis protein PilO [Deltaproteobacteria bacterium]MBW2399295.1 type 4a pilus biogenesis protein PilO [Deltaproteobacteria bacterium]MBW2665909.1 type 4a pilus biogenesis protein PilO [Deltaproteobacteria bacterium]
MEISPQVQEKIDQVAKLPKAARFGIIGGIGVAIIAGYFFLFYQENAEELKALHAQELELQRKLSEVRAIAANIFAFETEIEDLEIQLKTVLRQLPNTKELEVLLTDISNLGKTAGVEIRSFKRGKEVRHDFYAEVPINLELTGEFHDIAQFFDLVSRLPRIVNMGSLKISVVSEDEESTVLSVKGTATTFRFVGKGNA